MNRFRKGWKFIRVSGIVSLFLTISVWALSTQSCYSLLGSDWYAQLWGGVISLEKSPAVRMFRTRTGNPRGRTSNPGSSPFPLARSGDDLVFNVIHSKLYSSRHTLTFDTARGELNLIIPLWLPLVLAAGTICIAVFFGRPRRRPGHCVLCGYDLTGNVSGVCPECGAATSLESNNGRAEQKNGLQRLE